MRRQSYQAMRRDYFNAQADAHRASLREGRPVQNEFLLDLEESLRQGHRRASEFSIRGLAEQFIEDGAAVIESWNPRYNGHGQALLEGPGAVMTSDFANITGQLVVTRVLEAYNAPNLIGDQLCETISTVFDGEKIPGIGNVGDTIEQVSEGRPYPFAGMSEEWIETPATIKRGMIVPITKEAIFFDRTGVLLNRAGTVSTIIAVNKEKRILDMALGITTSYRRNGSAAQATYGDTHTNGDFDNLAATNALVDYTDIENALLLFDGMTDPNTGEPIIINSIQLVIPTALKMTAYRILNATEVQVGSTTSASVPVTKSPNPIQQPLTIVSNQYVKARTSSASTWFIGDFKQAVKYMENWPISVEQAPPNTSESFHNDIVAQWKVSERGAAAMFDPRYIVKSTA